LYLIIFSMYYLFHGWYSLLLRLDWLNVWQLNQPGCCQCF